MDRVLHFFRTSIKEKMHLDVEDVLQILDFPVLETYTARQHREYSFNINERVELQPKCLGKETRVRLSSQSAIKKGS